MSSITTHPLEVIEESHLPILRGLGYDGSQSSSSGCAIGCHPIADGVLIIVTALIISHIYLVPVSNAMKREPHMATDCAQTTHASELILEVCVICWTALSPKWVQKHQSMKATTAHVSQVNEAIRLKLFLK